ncbi:MAG: hypothetical protein WCT31_00255 [Candidatus Micrarchaeia archaeon]
MGEHLVQKLAYSYEFKEGDMRSILETKVLLEQDVLSFFGNREENEPLQKTMKDESLSMAEIQDDVSDVTGTVTTATQTSTEKESGEDRKYALTYYNPETGKSEVLAITSSVKIKDYAKQMVEESVGYHSSFPIYSFVATPIITTEINEAVLKDIKDNREYGTPPKFGGTAVVRITPVQARASVGEATSSVVAIGKQEAERNAVMEAVHRKEIVERKVGEELILLERAVNDIKRHNPSEHAISLLPPLSKARFQALKKKRLSDSTILVLLERDVSFLKNLRSKLKSLSVPELLDVAKIIKILKEK